jgi:hypothetical protein
MNDLPPSLSQFGLCAKIHRDFEREKNRKAKKDKVVALKLCEKLLKLRLLSYANASARPLFKMLVIVDMK